MSGEGTRSDARGYAAADRRLGAADRAHGAADRAHGAADRAHGAADRRLGAADKQHAAGGGGHRAGSGGLRLDLVIAVVQRDWSETLRNRLLLLTIIIPPVVLTIVPLLFGAIVRAQPLPPSLAQQVLSQRPAWRALAPSELTEAFGVQQFLVYFLLMPAYIPLAIASYSIIGEKLSRSLEAVLATPIRTAELLAGKALAALVPGVLTGWLTYLVFAWLAGVVYGPNLGSIVTDASWLAGAFLLGPAVGLVSVVAGVIVSSWVNDPRTAQQVGGVLIVPIVGLTIVQATGTVLIGAGGYVLSSIALTAVGLGGLWLGTRLFRRETILTRWR